MPQQHSPSSLNILLCQEQCTFHNNTLPSLPLISLDNEDDYLTTLISKEKATHFHSPADGILASHEGHRHDAVRWISGVSAFYGFTALTTVLAVNYFDRFVSTLKFQMDKPWMTHLTAVTCLSLAAKMEETQVPLLLDLQQVEESEFLFEAKTIQRMELLVLSTLNWRMNPVTPISFFQCVVTRLGFMNGLLSEFLCRCERVLLCLIVDSRVMSYPPSTLAAATMIHIIKEIEPFNATEYTDQLLDLLKISEEQVNECYKIMLKLLVCCGDVHNLHQKRKRLYEPSSPGGVIDASFSCDSSNDSWTVASPLSLSVEPVFKRSKAQDQHMRLPSINRMSVHLLNSPR
ncbi:cyclin-D3-3-like [Lotus japonicus]|uniref:cyclin-D3-3-like n=1 Tax=Lotus japonicus TaxID=34305 RepID=UPI00258AF3DE|nr:cyclin-D3-3-like [Lotus japonicus]